MRVVVFQIRLAQEKGITVRKVRNADLNVKCEHRAKFARDMAAGPTTAQVEDLRAIKRAWDIRL